MIRNRRGFTLLEVMIAVAIMAVAFSAIISVGTSSVSTSTRAKQMNIVGMLAKRAMIDAEYKIEGKTFEEMKGEEAGNFEAPYQDYKWKMAIKEVKFPTVSVGAGQSPGEGKTTAAELMTRLITKFLSDSIREVVVTVSWPRGKGEQSYTLSTYWVDLNHAFELQE